jgi:hypothetical protein
MRIDMGDHDEYQFIDIPDNHDEEEFLMAR